MRAGRPGGCYGSRNAGNRPRFFLWLAAARCSLYLIGRLSLSVMGDSDRLGVRSSFPSSIPLLLHARHACGAA